LSRENFRGREYNQGEYGSRGMVSGMGVAEKMDCRANGEVIFGVRRPSQSIFCERSSPFMKVDSPWGALTAKEKVMLNEQIFMRN
jgi:hypothetical protein